MKAANAVFACDLIALIVCDNFIKAVAVGHHTSLNRSRGRDTDAYDGGLNINANILTCLEIRTSRSNSRIPAVEGRHRNAFTVCNVNTCVTCGDVVECIAVWDHARLNRVWSFHFCAGFRGFDTNANVFICLKTRAISLDGWIPTVER